MMPLADALTCLERLDELAACLHDEVSFTLDHEPINHPQMIRFCARRIRPSTFRITIMA